MFQQRQPGGHGAEPRTHRNNAVVRLNDITEPETTSVVWASATTRRASTAQMRSTRHSLPSSTAARTSWFEWSFSFCSNFSNSVMASAADPAKPAKICPLDSVRTLLAPCLITVLSPKVTWPSPAKATSPFRRTAMIVVALISKLLPPSSPWMGLVINRFKFGSAHLSINLCGGQAGMA